MRDHPHACGDKLNIYNNHLRRAGSSPRVWGQVKHIPHKIRFVGIIPTRVGTSDYYINDDDGN